MAGFNLLGQNNQSTQQAPSFSSPGLNSSANFGSAPPQQNLSFGSSITSGTPLFGSPNVTVSQANLSFGSSTMGTPAVDASKSAFGFGLAGNIAPASTAGGTASFAATSSTQPTFGASNTTQATFGASSTTQPTFGATQPTFGPAQPNLSTAATSQSTFGGIATGQSIFGPATTGPPTFSGSGIAQSTFGGAVAVQPAFGGAVPASSTFSGAAAAQTTFGTAAQSTFGGAAATTQPTFGGIAATTQPIFGGVAAATVQPSFGAAATIQQPAFGGAATSQPLSFSVPTTQLVGAASMQPLSFGSSVAAPTLSFAAPTTSAAPLFTHTTLFGTTSAPSTISFATSTLSATNTTSAGTLSFGTPSMSQSLTFGTTSAAQPMLSFGSTSSAQTSSFGAVSTAPTLSFGAVSTAPMPSLGAVSTVQPISFAAPAAVQSTTAAAPSLSFGATTTTQPLFGATSMAPTAPKAADAAATASQPVGLTASSATTTSSIFSGLNASAASATTTSPPSLFSLPSVSGTSAATSVSFAWPKSSTETTTAQTSTSAGLGGVDHSAMTAAKSSANTITSVKEQPLPNEIQQTVIQVKEYVKTQKSLSSEVARSSAEPLNKLTQQIASLNNLILTLGSVLSQQKFTAEKIKMETIKSLNDYELAQKIKDSPVASEERLLSVRKYFAEKISAFEESTKVLQEKIEYVYQHVITLPQENSLSAEALKLIVKKLHDSFVVISARAYQLHNDMQLLKVQYLTLRNQFIKDNSSISFSLNRELLLPSESAGRKSQADSSHEGPNPFSRSGNGSFNSLLLNSQNRSFAAGSSKEWGPVGANATTSNPFGVGDFAGNSLLDQTYSLTSPSTNQPFNLQKPPLGNKRGKR